MTRTLQTQLMEVPNEMTSTSFEIAGYRIVQTLGVVRGITMRSRNVFGTMWGAMQTLRGGNIGMFIELAEKARGQSFDIMLHQAHLAGANAIIGVRYDANEMMQGVTEVLCYGTAVVVEAG